MVIFNHTFTADKPVIFPDNWETGKTLIELHEEWQKTTEYWIYSNLLQIAASSLLIALIIIIAIAWKQVRRIRKLNQKSITRKYQGRYASASFMVPLALLSTLCLYFLFVVVREEWTRLALLKGLAFCILAYGAYYCYGIWKQKLKQKRLKQVAEFNQKEAKKQ